MTKGFAVILIVACTLCYGAIIISIIKNTMGEQTGSKSASEKSGGTGGDSSSNDFGGTDGDSSSGDLVSTDIGSRQGDSTGTDRSSKSASTILRIITFILLAAYCYVAGSGEYAYISADQTAETAASFIQTGSFYAVNPLTGLPYSEGLPLREEILCLPGFYAMLGNIFEISAATVVYHIMPVYWMIVSFCACLTLSDSLWDKSKMHSLRHGFRLSPFESPCYGGQNTVDACIDAKKSDANDKAHTPGLYGDIFMLLLQLLVLCTNSAYFAEGFGLLSRGWAAKTVRAWVLVPFMLSCLLKRRYVPALLSIIAEGLIIWTLFGTGACLIMFLLLTLIMHKMSGKEAA